MSSVTEKIYFYESRSACGTTVKKNERNSKEIISEKNSFVRRNSMLACDFGRNTCTAGIKFKNPDNKHYDCASTLSKNYIDRQHRDHGDVIPDRPSNCSNTNDRSGYHFLNRTNPRKILGSLLPSGLNDEGECHEAFAPSKVGKRSDIWDFDENADDSDDASDDADDSNEESENYSDEDSHYDTSESDTGSSDSSLEEEFVCKNEKEQDVINNNCSGRKPFGSATGTESDGDSSVQCGTSDSDTGSAPSSYDELSSSEFLYCREECGKGWSEHDGDSPDSAADRHWLRYSRSKSSNSNRFSSENSALSTSRYGSVKRSSDVLTDDDEESSDLTNSSSKRFRRNEGRSVTFCQTERFYYSGSSFGSSSPLGASSFTTEPAVSSLSPLAAEEAERKESSIEASLPETSSQYYPICQSDSSLYSQGSNSSRGKRVSEETSKTLSADQLYGLFSALPSNPMPFQLHPIHHQDLHEYYCFMREKELVSHPYFCLRHQEKIRHTMRRILVEWLTMIAHHYKLHGESLHLTVNILDRYTKRQKGIYRGHYQLLGVTSLLVATKQLEVDMPPIATCLMLCRNLYSKAQLLSLERHLLDILCFDLNVPTAHTFLDYYIIADYFEHPVSVDKGRQQSNGTSYLKKVLCVSRRLLDIALAEYSFSQYLPSKAARAAMMLAEELVEIPCDRTSYGEDDFDFSTITCNRETSKGPISFADEPGYVDPEMSAVRCNKMPQFESRSGSVPNRRFRSTYSRFHNDRTVVCNEEQGRNPEYVDDLAEIWECRNRLESLVGTRELQCIKSSIERIVEKYSFE